MSVLKVNGVQVGQSATATQNFTLYQPATPDGTARLGNGNSGSVTDLLTFNSNGSVKFERASARITGDFSNATVSSRLMFQSSTTNGNTAVGAIPNGTSTQSQLTAFNASDPTNSAFAQVLASSAEIRIGSAIAGSGTYLPMTFYSGGGERMRIETGGHTIFGGASQEKRVAMAASDIDLRTGNYFTRTVSTTTTLTVSNTPAAGTAASFILDLTNGGSATVNWWSGMKWAGGTAPTLTTSGRDVLGFFTHDGGTTWTGLLLGKDVK